MDAKASGQVQTLERVWTSTLDMRVAPAFQLTLGGFFDPGASQQTRWTVSVSDTFRKSDKITFTAFNALSLPARHTNWWASLMYQWRVAQTGQWQWDASAGMERWRFPSVLCGTQDWVAAWSMSARRPARKVTWLATADGRTTLVSNLPRGSALVLGLQAQHPLHRFERGRLSLQHGPLYTHSWNLYGTHGPRVIRYSAAMAWTTSNWSIEAGLRPQAGLGPRVPDYLYWSAGVSYRFSQRLTTH